MNILWTNILHQIFPSVLKVKIKLMVLVELMVAQLLTWPIYEYSMDKYLTPNLSIGFKGKNKTYGFGRANGSTIADMANL